MAKISLNKLNLEKKTSVNTINFNDVEIEVLTYLPIEEKLELIQFVMDASASERFYNPALLDTVFHAYLVIYYTNLSLTATQNSNISATYDLMEKSGLIAEVVAAIPKEEYACLTEYLYSCVDVAEKQANSVISLISEAIEKMAGTIEDTKEKLSGIDLNSENIQTVLKIAKDNGAI